jgi:hypothetical protein
LRYRRRGDHREQERIMDTNEGMLDRTLRVLIGLVLIAFPLGVYGIENAHAWGWIGLVPLTTGLWGFCPLYALLGRKTA